MNNVTIMGRLVREPETRRVGETSVTSFTLAVEKQLTKEKRKEFESSGKATADFIPVSVWGKAGESVAKYVGKGSRLIVSGRLESQTSETEAGKRTFYQVTATSTNFIDFKSQDETTKNSEPSVPDVADVPEINDADLPF